MLSFNSTLVQLKDNKRANYFQRNAFQFHIGSIKRGEIGLVTDVVKVVSIPHWFN